MQTAQDKIRSKFYLSKTRVLEDAEFHGHGEKLIQGTAAAISILEWVGYSCNMRWKSRLIGNIFTIVVDFSFFYISYSKYFFLIVHILY